MDSYMSYQVQHVGRLSYEILIGIVVVRQRLELGLHSYGTEVLHRIGYGSITTVTSKFPFAVLILRPISLY
jgi:hypothetical protein